MRIALMQEYRFLGLDGNIELRPESRQLRFAGRKRSEKIKAAFANGNDGWQSGKRHQAFTHFRCVLGRMVRMNTGGGKNPPRALISQRYGLDAAGNVGTSNN
jgi:hypothetical protein